MSYFSLGRYKQQDLKILCGAVDVVRQLLQLNLQCPANLNGQYSAQLRSQD